ncbi:MAG: hypothetical protein JW934_00555 [Anaerolineae bacterium]|nr:hypothetical protein [Anaerolineae bacterium]
MPNQDTVADLFELAISAERGAEALYTRFTELFAEHPPVAEFWRVYARQESMHAEWLEQLADGLDEDQLAAAADATILKDAQKTLSFSLEQTLSTIETLEDAYQLASEMENGETNAVFAFLTEHLAPSDRLRTFLRGQLSDHLNKLLVDFPLEFQSATLRQQIKAGR